MKIAEYYIQFVVPVIQNTDNPSQKCYLLKTADYIQRVVPVIQIADPPKQKCYLPKIADYIFNVYSIYLAQKIDSPWQK